METLQRDAVEAGPSGATAAVPRVTGDHVGPRTPMGANLVADGATFRLWAPRAKAVHVVGRFGGHELWQVTDANRLSAIGNGHWAGFVPGVRSGDPYKFHVVGEGGEGRKRDPYARELSRQPAYPNCDCIVRDPSEYPWHDWAWRTPALNELIVYQLHVGTFWGPARQGSAARFLDVVDRLDYLADLGVTGVQLLPVVEFNAPRSMGYDGSDLFSPEMDYIVPPEGIGPYRDAVNRRLTARGLPPLPERLLDAPVNQMKAFVDLCHLHGLAVLLDVVYNHAGIAVAERYQHEHAEGIYNIDNAVIHNPNDTLYFTEQWHVGPVFAFWKAEVRQFLIDNAAFFIGEYHVDGLRYDQASVIVHQNEPDGWRFCQDCTGTAHHLDPQAVHIAEFWPTTPAVTESPPSGAGFDATWTDGLRRAVRNAIAAASGGAHAAVDLGPVAQALRAPGFQSKWRAVQYVESHDEVYWTEDRGDRIARLADPSNSRSWYARSRARVATGLVLAAPGIPMLFMGQEFLEDKRWSDDPYHHGGLLHWEGLQGGDKVMADHHRFCRDLIGLRRRHPGLRGEGLHVISVDPRNRVIAFQRWVEGVGCDTVVVASLNEHTLYGYRLGMPRVGRWLELFNSDVYDGWVNPEVAGNGGGIEAVGDGMHGLSASAAMTIPANAILVFSQDGVGG